MKKYELVPANVKFEGVNCELFQIRSLVDLDDLVHVGSMGGFVAGEHNLSHDGTCWIEGAAACYENGHVGGDARLSGYARLYGNAKLYGNARISDRAEAFGCAEIHDDAWVFGNAEIYGDAKIRGKARVSGNQLIGAKNVIE